MTIEPGIDIKDRRLVEDAIVDALDVRYPGWGEVTGRGGYADGSESDIGFELVQSADAVSIARVMGASATETLREAAQGPGSRIVRVDAQGKVLWSGVVL
ncbi:hypothetical protein ACWZJV_14445 [Nocardioides sp. WG-D5]